MEKPGDPSATAFRADPIVGFDVGDQFLYDDRFPHDPRIRIVDVPARNTAVGEHQDHGLHPA